MKYKLAILSSLFITQSCGLKNQSADTVDRDGTSRSVTYSSKQDGKLPQFTNPKIALMPRDLNHAPDNDLIHPTVIRAKDHIDKPLGTYYIYYSPHEHKGISMAYSNSIEGPWKEYKNNPVIKGPAAADMRWIEGEKKYFMWGHSKNSESKYWTSKDGINFRPGQVSVKASVIGTRNASYTRVYKYRIEKYKSNYIMLYSGLKNGKIRHVWFAHSKDAKNWTQVRTPLVSPTQNENNQLFGPSFIRYKDQNFVIYQDNQSRNSGGNIKYVVVDDEFSPVGNKGKRRVLMRPPEKEFYKNRLRGADFMVENDRIYMFSGAAKKYNEFLIWAKAKISKD